MPFQQRININLTKKEPTLRSLYSLNDRFRTPLIFILISVPSYTFDWMLGTFCFGRSFIFNTAHNTHTHEWACMHWILSFRDLLFSFSHFLPHSLLFIEFSGYSKKSLYNWKCVFSDNVSWSSFFYHFITNICLCECFFPLFLSFSVVHHSIKMRIQKEDDGRTSINEFPVIMSNLFHLNTLNGLNFEHKHIKLIRFILQHLIFNKICIFRWSLEICHSFEAILWIYIRFFFFATFFDDFRTEQCPLLSTHSDFY